MPGAGVAVVVNRTAPAAPTGLTAHDTPSDAGGSITVGWVPSPDDGSGANDVASYEIARRAVGDLAFTAVAGAGAGSTSATDGVATDGVLYEYRVTAIDLAGNRGTSSVYGPVISIDNTQGDVTAPAEVTGLSATPGNGFAYLSWTRSADTFGGALDVVDQLLDLSTDGGANYGPPVSLGKETSFRLVDGLSNGQGYRARLRVQNSTGNVSAGAVIDVTPSPTAVTTVSGTISSDTTWAAGVFRVTGDITVNAGVTLTVAPGVIVKFDGNRRITVNGTLNAIGTSGQKVTFTSFTDDTAGGDSNGNGPSSGAPGSWRDIYYNNGSAGRLEHVVARFGGAASVGNVYVESTGSAIQIVSSEFRNSSTMGIRLYNSSP